MRLRGGSAKKHGLRGLRGRRGPGRSRGFALLDWLPWWRRQTNTMVLTRVTTTSALIIVVAAGAAGAEPGAGADTAAAAAATPASNWCSRVPCAPQKTQPPCVPSPPPSPWPPPPSCHSHACPDDLLNSGIAGVFPDGSEPCSSTKICVEDVFPGCGCYRGDSDSAWGIWCEDAIAAFDTGGVINKSNISAHTAPQNIGGDPQRGNPIYYFAVPKPQAYVLYLPPSNALPISAASGRYEYFLLQYLRSKGMGVFVLRTPDPETDLWDHVPAHNKTSPYEYNCSRIKSGYPFCTEPCDMCSKPRSTSLIEAAIDKAAALGYTKEMILMGWSSGGSMASAFLNVAFESGFTTARSKSYNISGMVLLNSGSQFCYA